MGIVLGVLFLGWILGSLIWAARKHPDVRMSVIYVLVVLLIVVIFSQYTGIEWGTDDR